MRTADLDGRLAQTLAACPDVRWSAAIRAASTGDLLAAAAEDAVLSTASVGKVLLLVEAARQFETGELSETELLARSTVPPVADSGLWQHLAVDTLPAADVCALVAAVSDNLATNVLLRELGLARVARTAGHLELEATALCDEVRDVRGPGLPPHLSVATAAELTEFFALLHRGALLTAAVSHRVRRWLSLDADLSMAASAFSLDPLAHQAPDRGVTLVHKTGTDACVRADAGLVEGPAGAYAYAFLANWAPDEDRRDAVLDTMRVLGALLAELVVPAAP